MNTACLLPVSNATLPPSPDQFVRFSVTDPWIVCNSYVSARKALVLAVCMRYRGFLAILFSAHNYTSPY